MAADQCWKPFRSLVIFFCKVRFAPAPNQSISLVVKKAWAGDHSVTRLCNVTGWQFNSRMPASTIGNPVYAISTTLQILMSLCYAMLIHRSLFRSGMIPVTLLRESD
jgi:hypothetical protein